MLNGAVLASGVHRLKHEQQRPSVLSIELVLLLCEPLCAETQEFGRLPLIYLEVAGIAGVKVLQPESLAFGDAEWIDIFLNPIKDFFSLHSTQPPSRGTSASDAAALGGRCQSQRQHPWSG